MSATKFNTASVRTLANGVQVPLVGLGVYQSRGEECTNAVITALEAGYRHVDCALAYRNESLVGEAFSRSKIARSDFFFTTKLPPGKRGYDETRKAIDESLQNCKLDYIDLYLIHAPYGNRESRLGQWKAIEEAVTEKKIRAAGVSNYGIPHLKELLDSKPKIKPQVNQLELHPWLCRTDLVKFCEDNEVVLEAYSPLTRGQKVADPKLEKIADRLGRSPAQILIRWSLQKGFITLPKSVTPERIQTNFQVFDFELSSDDMGELDAFDEDLVTGWDPTVEPL